MDLIRIIIENNYGALFFQFFEKKLMKVIGMAVANFAELSFATSAFPQTLELSTRHCEKVSAKRIKDSPGFSQVILTTII